MHILINTRKELEMFRFWYLNVHNIDVAKESLEYYCSNRYAIPVTVQLNNDMTIYGHQGVEEEGQSWEDWINTSNAGRKFKNWSGIPMNDFIKKY